MNKLFNGIKLFKAKPARFVTDIIGAVPDPCQVEILESVANNPRTTVRSGHGVGKSTVMAWAALWFLICHPNPKVPCTAPTEHQLKDILWAELAKWIYNSPLKSVLSWTNERVFMKGHAATWFAVARTAAKADALQGFHGDHILFLIDEASGVKDDLFQPVLGALTTEGAKLLMAGNPTSISGFFADSHMSQMEQYHTIRVDGRNSPRVTAESVQLIIDMFGEDSDPFRIRVAGEFPKAMPDSFIPIDWIERNSKQSISDTLQYSVDLGVDVARYGDDNSVIYGVLDKTKAKRLEKISKNDIMQVTGAVVKHLRFFNTKYKNITPSVKIDCDGLGVGVHDRLKELNANGEIRCNLHECHFGGEGGRMRQGDPIAYANNTGLMWGKIRDMLQNNQLELENNKELKTQLSNRRYSLNSDGKILLERKEDMKKRGVKSPDDGDALALALYERRSSIAILP